MWNVGKFEKKFAEYQQCKHAVLFNSGGSANLAMLQAPKNMGKLKDGDKIGFFCIKPGLTKHNAYHSDEYGSCCNRCYPRK